jgi:hypothetical protein
MVSVAYPADEVALQCRLEVVTGKATGGGDQQRLGLPAGNILLPT